MKIVHLNTSVDWSSAPYKLHRALLEGEISSTLLAMQAEEGLEGVYTIRRDWSYRIKRKVCSIVRNVWMRHYHPVAYMPFTAMPIGMDICKNELVQNADLIWIHWVGGDYMSPKTIEELLKTGKSVFWTCHDNYPFTGGCHVRMGCDFYEKECGNCPQLQSNRQNDITERLLSEKKRRFDYPNLYMISPSSWMDKNVQKSAVFQNSKHFILPNVIDTKLFHDYDKVQVRDELGLEQDAFVILAGLKSNEKIPYNGTEYLWGILRRVLTKEVQKHLGNSKVQIVVFGVVELTHNQDMPLKNFGYIREHEKLAKVYSAADVYFITSLEDSFNQTAAECMACSTPVVAFRNGGIEDVIDHKKNGYLAEYKNVDDLARGIEWVLNNNPDNVLGKQGRKKVMEEFSAGVVVEKYIGLYNSTLHDVRENNEQKTN